MIIILGKRILQSKHYLSSQTHNFLTPLLLHSFIVENFSDYGVKVVLYNFPPFSFIFCDDVVSYLKFYFIERNFSFRPKKCQTQIWVK